MDSKQSASGVQQLIGRLRDEGVGEGRRQAEQLVEDARAKAEQILREATDQAAQAKKHAEVESDRLQKAAKSALQLAVRDATLKLREEIQDRFAGQLRELVSRQMSNGDFLKQMLMEVTRQAVPSGDAGPTRVMLPESVVTLEQLRQNPDELENGSLTQFVVSIAKEALGKGVELAPGPDNKAGIRIELVENDLRIDLTDEAVTGLLLKHLTPRFRALLGQG